MPRLHKFTTQPQSISVPLDLNPTFKWASPDCHITLERREKYKITDVDQGQITIENYSMDIVYSGKSWMPIALNPTYLGLHKCFNLSPQSIGDHLI